MPKKSKKRARQAKRRAERRDVKPQLEPTPAELLLGRIRSEARRRLEAAARRADAEQDEAERRLERAKARGKA